MKEREAMGGKSQEGEKRKKGGGREGGRERMTASVGKAGSSVCRTCFLKQDDSSRMPG